MAQSQTLNEKDPLITRVTKVTNERFSVTLCEQSYNGAHISEDVGYIAMEPGTGVMCGNNFVVDHLEAYVKDISDEEITLIDISEHFDNDDEVRFIADIQTYKDETAANLRCAPPVEKFEVAIDNHWDTNLIHRNEKIGFFAIGGSCGIFAERVVTDPDKRDTDGDGINDSEEKDTGMSPIYSDTDGDGIDDSTEMAMEFSYYDEEEGGIVIGKLDPTKDDTDGDGVSDYDEINGNIRYVTDHQEKGYYFRNKSGEESFQIEYHTNPLMNDTDMDGAEDGSDPIPLDYDMDGDGELNHDCYEILGIDEEKIYTDGFIRLGSKDNNIDGDDQINLQDDDVDNDGMTNEYEVKYGDIDEITTDDIKLKEGIHNEVDGEGWQNPWVYNGRYALLLAEGETGKVGETIRPEASKKSIYEYHEALVKEFNYQNDNIYCHVGQLEKDDIVDGPNIVLFQNYLVKKRPNVNYVDYSMNEIYSKITNNDFFTYVYCGHTTDSFSYNRYHPGEGNSMPMTLSYPEHVFRDFTNSIPNARMLMVFDACLAGRNVQEHSNKDRITIGCVQIVPDESVEAKVRKEGHVFSSGFSVSTTNAAQIISSLILYVWGVSPGYTVSPFGFIDGLKYGWSLIPAFKWGTTCWAEYQQFADWSKDRYQGVRKPLLEDNYDDDWEFYEDNQLVGHYGHKWDYIKNHYTTKGEDGWLASLTYL